MSSLAGIIGARGKAAELGDLRAMLAAMARRGPDGAALWTSGRAGLGHGLLATLPEPAEDAQPLSWDGLTIVADARLDNRAELIEALATANPALSDARLILAAYRRWGRDCPARLLGDFAFAIWDEPDQTLFAARDHSGVKPFYYAPGQEPFAFASDIAGVLAAPGVSRAIEEARIAEYLAGVPPQIDKTLYAAVLRLPPAHWLAWSDGRLVLQPYWSVDRSPRTAPKDAPEAFLETFSRAVADRMRSTTPVGAMLSGGMDSSSITVVAEPMSRALFGKPLATYSMVFDKTPRLSERPFIEAVLERGQYDPNFLDCDDFSSLARVGRTLEEQSGLYLAPALDLSSLLYDQARERGTKVILSGHGGDEVISQGFGRLMELAATGRWLKLRRELAAATDIYGYAAGPEFRKYVINFTALRSVRANWRRARNRFTALWGPAPAPPRPAWARLINPDLAQRTKVADAYQETLSAASRARTQRDYHLAITDGRMQSYGLEVLDRVAAGAGIEARYPFWDKRVLELCLSLAPEDILDDGWPRLVLRRAMEGLLPAKVQWRRDKLDFTPHLIRGMINQHREALDAIILQDRDDIGAYIDLVGAAAAWRRMTAAGEAADGYDSQLVWRTAVFAQWLRGARALPGGAQITGSPLDT